MIFDHRRSPPPRYCSFLDTSPHRTRMHGHSFSTPFPSPRKHACCVDLQPLAATAQQGKRAAGGDDDDDENFARQLQAGDFLSASAGASGTVGEGAEMGLGGGGINGFAPAQPEGTASALPTTKWGSIVPKDENAEDGFDNLGNDISRVANQASWRCFSEVHHKNALRSVFPFCSSPSFAHDDAHCSTAVPPVLPCSKKGAVLSFYSTPGEAGLKSKEASHRLPAGTSAVPRHSHCSPTNSTNSLEKCSATRKSLEEETPHTLPSPRIIPCCLRAPHSPCRPFGRQRRRHTSGSSTQKHKRSGTRCARRVGAGRCSFENVALCLILTVQTQPPATPHANLKKTYSATAAVCVRPISAPQLQVPPTVFPPYPAFSEGNLLATTPALCPPEKCSSLRESGSFRAVVSEKDAKPPNLSVRFTNQHPPTATSSLFLRPHNNTTAAIHSRFCRGGIARKARAVSQGLTGLVVR